MGGDKDIIEAEKIRTNSTIQEANVSKQFSPEVKEMLEGLIGKPYEQITLDDLDKISPGINDDLCIENAKIIAEILKGW